ncbi:hypothetical protein HDU92_004479 [Lobulomyces angularis]|nr:hypothetical protein HDU92_004479 [Lobulomyces angularis]
MSMLQVFGDSKKLEYTFKSYESFYNLINEKKDSLKENNIDFTNQEIEQSLFADKILNLCGSKKRKHDVSEDTGIVVENNQKKKKGK